MYILFELVCWNVPSLISDKCIQTAETQGGGSSPPRGHSLPPQPEVWPAFPGDGECGPHWCVQEHIYIEENALFSRTSSSSCFFLL